MIIHREYRAGPLKKTVLGAAFFCLVAIAPATAQSAGISLYDSLCTASARAVDRGEFDPDRSERDSLFAAAEHDARAAVAANPNGAQGHFQLARAIGRKALSVGLRERARYAVEVRAQALAALALDPNHAGALHVLGVWNQQVMQLSAIQRFLAKTLLGAGVLGKASWQEAVRDLEDAVAFEPDRIVHRLDLARVYIARKRISEARQQLRQILTAPDRDYNDPNYRREAEAELKSLRA